MNIDLGKSFVDALGISPGDLVSIAGAGGKTSLMYALGRELAARGDRVLLTTTTKVFFPKGREVGGIMLGPENEGTMAEIKSRLEDGHLLLAGRDKQQGKIIGFSTGFVDAFHSQSGRATVVSECDGAMGKSLKVPRAWEPVLPSGTTIYVVVIGADCLGRSLDVETAFEPEAFGALAGVPPGTEVDVRLVAGMMLAPGSYVDRKPSKARCCIFINKWDTVRSQGGGRETGSDEDRAMALALSLAGAPGVDRVTLGSLKPGTRYPIMVIR